MKAGRNHDNVRMNQDLMYWKWTSNYMPRHTIVIWQATDLSYTCNVINTDGWINKPVIQVRISFAVCVRSERHRNKCRQWHKIFLVAAFYSCGLLQRAVIDGNWNDRWSYVHMFLFNLLKPTGHVMHQQFNIQQLYVLPTLYLCVLYLSENKQRLVPLTA